jgi:RimJ/RimL family protein N-acetyltransferase
MNQFIKGSRTYLRLYQEGDCESIARWLNDAEVTNFMFYGQLPMTLDEVKVFIECQIASPDNIVFIICKREVVKDTPIGFCGLYDWHRTAHKAEMRILVGEKIDWGTGIGTEVVEMLTWYGFDRLNLHRIYLGFTQSNKAAGRVYEKAGYEEEGILRDDIFRNGRYYDSVRMGILRARYEKLYQSDFQKRFGQALPKFIKES